jgi:protein-L-isoaspartate(D-aspartate) O-methyltransferase
MDPRPPDNDASAAERERMVTTQLRSRGVADERVLAAIQAVPREDFVRPDLRRAAYADDALPIEAGQTISQPYIVALMTELLSVGTGDRVLEIGTGSGYQAAVLAELGCVVVTIERHRELAESARARLERLGFGDRVEVRVGDGSVGDPDGAPWRGILVAAAAPRVPDALRNQLAADGGRLVLPVGEPGRQELVVVVRDGDRWNQKTAGRVAFVPLIGEAGFAGDER